MDNTLGYELRNGGSIPSGGAKYAWLVFNGLAQLASTQQVGVRISYPAPVLGFFQQTLINFSLYENLKCESCYFYVPVTERPM